MIKLFGSLTLLFVVATASPASAQLIAPDSAYTDSIFVYEQGDQFLNQNNIMGVPDSSLSRFGPGGGTLAVYFRPGPQSKKIYRIEPNADLVIYGTRDETLADTVVGVFMQFVNSELNPARYSNTYLIKDEITRIKVPDSTYTHIEFTMVGYNGVDYVQKTSFYIDAILLVQEFDLLNVATPRVRLRGGAITSLYPNPFTPKETPTLNFRVDRPAEVSFVVRDVTGRQWATMDLGMYSPGIHTVPLSISESGFYFIQMLVDGFPMGEAYKLQVHDQP